MGNITTGTELVRRMNEREEEMFLSVDYKSRRF
jgi:hypothetical protein